MDTHKACIECGARFLKSPADSTVRCPACRANRVVAAAKKVAWPAVTCDIHGIEYTTINCPKCFPKS